MSISKKRSINLLLAFALLLSVIVPNLAMAVGGTSNGNYTVIGDENNQKLTITKYAIGSGYEDLVDGSGRPVVVEGHTPIEGVTFELTQTHAYDPTKDGTDEDAWTPVTGVAQVLTGTTNEDGVIVFNKVGGLKLGRYEVQEISGPAGVILNSKFTVDVPMTDSDRKTLNYDVHVYPKNEEVSGDGELVKKNDAGEPIDEVKFGLYKTDLTGVTLVDKLTTANGGKINFTGLAAGEYFFQEISTVAPYALNTTKIPFEVKQNEAKESVVVWGQTDINTGNVVVNHLKPTIDKKVNGQKAIVAINRDLEYKYNLIVTVPQDIKKYKALGVTDTLDSRLEFITDGTIKPDGWEVVAAGLTKDDIDFRQEGQKLVWEVKRASLSKLTPGQEITINFTAKIKKDAVITDEDLITGEEVKENGALVEGNKGIKNRAKLHFNNGKGEYTKPIDPRDPITPPGDDPYDPYDPEDPNKPVDPKDPNKPYDPTDPEYPKPEEPPVTPPVVVVPTEGGLKIVKVDKADTSLKLEGAEFKLTTDEAGQNVVDATGTIIKVDGVAFTGKLENLATGDNGEILIDGLTPGTYYLHETKAPVYMDNGVQKPYRLLTKPLEVVVGNKVESEQVIVKNSKSGWNLPTTGGMGTILFTFIGIAFMGVAFFLLSKNKKVEN